MITSATLVFLLGLVVIDALRRYARIVTIVLSVVAIGLFFESAEMAGPNMPTEAPHWDPALTMIAG